MTAADPSRPRWRRCASVVADVLGAVGGPAAAYFTLEGFSAAAADDAAPAVRLGGLSSAIGVACAWIGFARLERPGLPGALLRGVAIGAASVGVACGAVLACLVAFMCCMPFCWGDVVEWSFEASLCFFAAVLLTVPAACLALPCRLWARVARPRAVRRSDLVDGAEAVAALSFAAAIIAASGVDAGLGAIFGVFAVSFVAGGLYRSLRPSRATPGHEPSSS